MKPYELENKCAFITGGGRGIGAATAELFGSAGASVAVVDVDMDAAQKVVEDIRRNDREAIAIRCDITDEAAVERAFEECIGELGGLDILVNNAGMAPVAPSALAVSEDLFDKIVAVNLKGPLRLSALAAEQMREGGVIVNVSTMASLKPTPQTLVYAAAKAGLNALTSALAQELAPRRIRVNCLVPGAFWTDSLAKALPTEEAAESLTPSVHVVRQKPVDVSHGGLHLREARKLRDAVPLAVLRSDDATVRALADRLNVERK